VGAVRFHKLLTEFGSMKAAWSAPAERLRKLLGSKIVDGRQKTGTTWDPDRELEALRQSGFRVLCSPDQNYPTNLKKISDPPPVLYCWGGLEYGDDVAVAIVGTRNPTPLGAYHARELSAQLSREGLTVVSGMARGIDSEAHQGALQSGGRTIAVLGCGLDIVYPPENEELMRRIAARGAAVTEYPLGTPPLAGNFPARNRIISGLSLGVVVVEATHDSGSLITADFAAHQGRDVFAVPGNVGNEGSKGPHKLIREGAKLVEDYRDILSELAIPQLAAADFDAAPTLNLTETEWKVCHALNREPSHINQVQHRSGLSSAQVNSALTRLELKGVVKRFPGQLYLRVK
jgi:DNA processing protein